MKQAIVFLAIIIAVSLNPFAQTPKTTIIWEDGASGCEVIAVDGLYYRITSHNDLAVAFNAMRTKSLVIATVMIVNNSNDRIIIEPGASAFTVWKDSDRRSVDVIPPMSPEKINAQIDNRADWANFLRAFAAGFVGATPDRDAQYQALQRYAAALAETADQRTDVRDAALKSNTLFPGQFAIGSIFFRRKKFDTGHFAIQINDTAYNFPTSPPQKQ